MRAGILLVVCAILAGCAMPPRHQEGGEASAVLPAVAQSSEIRLKQPENPEGASSIGYRERRETTHADGTVEVYEREAGTDLGGSQDLAEMIGEVMKGNMFRGLLLGVALIFCAVVGVSKGWPILGGVLGMGGLASIIMVWWAGLLAVLAALLLFTAYQVAIAQGVPLPPRPSI